MRRWRPDWAAREPGSAGSVNQARGRRATMTRPPNRATMSAAFPLQVLAPHEYSSTCGASARMIVVCVTWGTGIPTVVSLTTAPVVPRSALASKGAHSLSCAGSVSALPTTVPRRHVIVSVISCCEPLVARADAPGRDGAPRRRDASTTTVERATATRRSRSVTRAAAGRDGAAPRRSIPRNRRHEVCHNRDDGSQAPCAVFVDGSRPGDHVGGCAVGLERR